MPTPEQVGWTAGIIDGEGCISAYGQVRKTGPGKVWSLRVLVANTDVRMIHRLEDLWGGKIRRHGKPQKDSHTQAWLWEVCGQAARKFLSLIRSELVVKQEQADLAIEFAGLLGTPGGCKVDEDNLQRREELSSRLKLAKVVGRLEDN